MSEPVDIDNLPVKLKTRQQKLWDSGDKGKREVRKEIREERREKQYPEGEGFEPDPDFNALMGDDL